MKTRATNTRRSGESGVVLAAALSVFALVSVLLVVLLAGVSKEKDWTNVQQNDQRADAVAEMAIALAADLLWSGYERAFGPDDLQPWNFKAHMSNQGIQDQAGVSTPVGTDFLGNLGITPDTNGDYPLAGGYLVSLEVLRRDTWDASQISIIAEAVIARNPSNGKGQAITRAQQFFDVVRPDWEGLDFALLANNVNCILCHTKIDNAERFYNNDPDLRSGFDRVRVGSLESMQFRDDPESVIAGALYMGGQALLADGSKLTDWGGLNLKSVHWDEEGKMSEDAFGNLALQDIVPATPGSPIPGENLYLDYLSGDEEDQIDGLLPTNFPSPFPDNGGLDEATGVHTPEFADNRVVDHNEFLAATARANGTISGTNIGVVSSGQTLGNQSDVQGAFSSGPSNLDSRTEGNVILHGTESDPIELDGLVAIDGDLVISGYVVGSGAIMASGNVYIPGEVNFLDGTDGSGERTYGTSAAGVKNSLGITSGGNMVIGDPSHPMFGQGAPVDGTPNTEFNFVMEEIAIFNRSEWMKTQPTLPGESVHTLVGTHIETRTVQPTRIETYWEDVDIYESQATEDTVTVPIMEDVQVGTETVPSYEQVQVGTQMVDDYSTIHHPATTYEAAWDERVLIGSHEEPIMEQQQTGTTEQPVYERQQTGTREDTVYADVYVRTDSVERERTVDDGLPYTVDDVVEDWEWVAPQHPNPFYKGVDYIARYYAFSESAPVPIFNQEGFFDPAAEIWSSVERAEGWDTGRLSQADPGDPTDPILYNVDGSPRAVVSTLTPTSDWLSAELLDDLVDDQLAERDADTPVGIDATLYSANSVFGVIPSRGQDGVSGKLRINGGVIAPDVGILAPNGLQLNYDKRNAAQLKIPDDRKMVMRKALWAPSN